MTDFKVPFGLDPQGILIPPGLADKDIAYTCPNPKCGGPLILSVGIKIRRDGNTRATHFKHKPATYDRSICFLETWAHETAKERIHQVVQGWIDGKGPVPQITSPTRADVLSRLIEAMSKGAKPSHVQIEKPYKDLTPDVSLIFDKDGVGVLALAVEIRSTHAVNAQKAKKFAKYEIAWIELDAHAIIANPAVWQDIAEPQMELHLVSSAARNQTTRTATAPAGAGAKAFQIPQWLKTTGVIAGLSAVGWLLSSLDDDDEQPRRRRRS